MAVLAPPGFPPAKALEARLKQLCAAQQVVGFFVEAEVNGPRDAFTQYARGVPSVWIGGTEIEAVKGGRPAFAVRTFAGPGGGRALLPGDEALSAAIAAEAAIVRGGRSRATYDRLGKRKARGDAALERWLATHAPGEHRERMVAGSLNAACSQGYWQYQSRLPHPSHALAKALGKRDLPALLAKEDDLQGCAGDAIGDAYERVVALLGALEQSAPGITRAEPAAEIGLAALLEHVEVELAGNAVEGAVFARSIAAAPAVMEICRGVDVAPIDGVCARACVLEAITRLWEIWSGDDPLAALQAARERFDAAVEHAIQRHEERDADGHPPPCYLLQAALGALYGRASPAILPTGPSPVAIAVQAAWQEAMTAGLDEVEAANRCLAVAAAETDKKKR
jgi:hypothetical protein